MLAQSVPTETLMRRSKSAAFFLLSGHEWFACSRIDLGWRHVPIHVVDAGLDGLLRALELFAELGFRLFRRAGHAEVVEHR